MKFNVLNIKTPPEPDNQNSAELIGKSNYDSDRHHIAIDECSSVKSGNTN